MKRYFAIISTLIFLVLTSTCLYSQSTSNKPQTSIPVGFTKDSLELKTLVIDLLKWHEKDKHADFDFKKNDSVYVGIDWQKHKARMTELEGTNLFTKHFLDNYQKIALHLDKELRENKEKYYVGDLPPYGNESNEWCNCQDYLGNIWNVLKIVNLKIKDTTATFKWTWSKGFSYSVKATKENNVWKIAELERFNITNFS